MDRLLALNELKVRLANDDYINHSLAVEAIMRELAAMFQEDIEKWGLVGLLHDIDYGLTVNDISKRGILGAEILEYLGVDQSIIYSIKARNDYHGIERKRKMDKCLYAADPLSSLITASALILPSRKMACVTVEFVMNRYNDKGFAKEADREKIETCSKVGLSLEQFIGIGISAMQKIADDLGL